MTETVMTFEQVLKSRRSVRSYKDTPVDMATIKSLIGESIMAPSSGNRQPWKFIIVNDKEMMAEISGESKKNLLERIAKNPDDYAKRYEDMLKNENYNVFYNAPALIMIVGDPAVKNLHSDCALAACYLMMAATARGLGTCWVNLGAFIKDPEMLRRLGIPEGYAICAPIILGYPEKIPSAPARKAPEILSIIE